MVLFNMASHSKQSDAYNAMLDIARNFFMKNVRVIAFLSYEFEDQLVNIIMLQYFY